MSEVTRFNFKFGSERYESRLGWYVLHSDYAALEAANAELTKRLEELQSTSSATVIRDLQRRLEEAETWTIKYCEHHLMELKEDRRADHPSIGIKVAFTLAVYRDKLAALTAQLAAAEAKLQGDGEWAKWKTRLIGLQQDQLGLIDKLAAAEAERDEARAKFVSMKAQFEEVCERG